MQCFNGILTSRPLLFLFVSLTCVMHSVQADQVTESMSDCGEVDIRYSDDPTLTRAEKLQLMEKAFFDSLSRFEICNLANKSNDASAQDSGSAAGGGAAGGQQSAVASSELEGTEESPAEAAAASSAEAFAENDNLEAPPPIQSRASGSGAIPDDIPPANNDDAIAAQIRLAAEREPDPEIQKKLWNEYRKYKGLKIEE